MSSIDFMFVQLITDNIWATTIAGFVLVLIILFSAIVVFGKNKVEIGGFGILLIVFLGSVLATVLGLFPAYILLVFLVLSIVAILINSLFFRGKLNG